MSYIRSVGLVQTNSQAIIPSIKFGRNVVTKGVFFFRKGTLEE